MIGFMRMRLGQAALAARSYRRACDLEREVVAADPKAPHFRVLLAMGLALLQSVLVEPASAKEAEEADRQALKLVQALVAEYPEVPYYWELQGWTCDLLASGREHRGDRQGRVLALRLAMDSYDSLNREFPTVHRYRARLMVIEQEIGTMQWEDGQVARAAEVFRQHIARWEARLRPDDAESHASFGEFLANCPDPRFRDPAKGVRLTKRAVELAPNDGSHWYSLGVAHYRAGNWHEAIAALNNAGRLAEPDGWDFFFVAMCHAKLKEPAEARKWYDRAVAWADKNEPRNMRLLRLRAEAQQVLGK
jgi:tetratricopeptide (TPR) repeat protein